MADEPSVDYSTVLADLERRRDALTTAIDAIRMIADPQGAEAHNGAPAAPRTPAPRGIGGGTMRPDEFFGMSILQAAKRYLAIVKQPKSATEIAKTVKEHGLLNTSKGFQNTVYSVLYREAERGGRSVVKVGNAWGLSEWYPNRPKPKAKGQSPAPEAGDEDETGE